MDYGKKGYIKHKAKEMETAYQAAQQKQREAEQKVLRDFMLGGMNQPCPAIDKEVSPREAILTSAIRHTCGERNVQYGSPFVNLSDCAALWTAYLQGKFKGSTLDPNMFILSAEDVAHLNTLQKIARTFNGNYIPDTYEDAAAYSAIAGECAKIEENHQ
jgi:hypothetical protein